MNNKTCTFIIVPFLLLLFLTGAAAHARSGHKKKGDESAVTKARIIINGVALQTPGMIFQKRTFVPIRHVFERLGAKVHFSKATEEVRVEFQKTTIMARAGDAVVKIFRMGKAPEIIHLDVPPQIINGRLYVPMRPFARGLGVHLFWDGKTKTLEIIKR